MFKRWLGRPESVDIDQLIFDIAEHKRAKDHEAFFELIKGRSFFFRVDPASTTQIPKGVPYRSQPNDAVKIPFLANINGLRLIPLYTFRGDKRLTNSYVEIEGIEALRMATRATGIDGILFQNRMDSWIALDMEKIKSLLATHNS